MSWPKRQIGEVADILSGNAWKSANFSSEPGVGLPVIRIQNVSDTKTEFVYWGGEPLEKYIIKNGDLLLSLSGNVKLCQWQFGEALLNQRVVRLSPRVGIDTRYFYWSLSRVVQKIEALAKHAVIANVSVSDLKSFEIPLPPLAEQKRIAAILDKADAIRRKRQQAIQLADDFLRAVFLDMFGDPVANPKGWETKLTTEVGTFKNGMNYGKDESGQSLHCLGVGDFKRLDRIDDVTTLSKINLNTLPSRDYLLKDGDLIFVRSNGNKALVGRCLAVYPGNTSLTFSGFCIRFRINSPEVISDYMNYLFRMPSLKNRLLSGGQGANIQNINQKRLSEITVPLPPRELQDKFANIVSEFKSSQRKSFESKEQQKKVLLSLSQKAFLGQL